MSANPLSPAAQATLLLCSPLRAGRNKNGQLLSIGEFDELEKQLQGIGAGLEQLLEADAAALLKKISPAVDGAKIETLLGRGFLLSLAVETWQSAGVRVINRNEKGYPERLRRLKQNASALLYGCGEKKLLARGGLAIVGSRDVDAAGEEFTRPVAASAVREDMQVVSGGARGVDQLAIPDALEAGGTVVGALADSVLRSATSGKARESIQDGRLTLVSAFDPEAGFNAGNTMQRNQQIYAMADFGLVVSSSYDEGGTGSARLSNLKNFISRRSLCALATMCRKGIANCFGVTRCRFRPNRGRVRCARFLKPRHREIFSPRKRRTCSLYLKSLRNILTADASRLDFSAKKKALK